MEKSSSPTAGYVVGFRLDGPTHLGVGKLPPQTPLDQRQFPPWAALLDKKRAHAAVTRHRKAVAKSLSCPDRRLHPHLCNCKMPRERVPTPKTDIRKHKHQRKQRLITKHVKGQLNTFERVEAAKAVYLAPGLWDEKVTPHYMTPHAELQLCIHLPMEVAVVQLQKIWRGLQGRRKFRREYWKEGMKILAKSFDTWNKAVQYKVSLKRLASARYIQRNVRAIWEWRINRRMFILRATRIAALRKLLESLTSSKYFCAWKWCVKITTHRRKYALTIFHLRRHASLQKIFRVTRMNMLRNGLLHMWWEKYVVEIYRAREYFSRCSIAFSRWLRLYYENNALRKRRMRIMFRAWSLFTKHQIFASMQRQKIWAAGILQREWRCYTKKHRYREMKACAEFINRFWRGTLARAEAARRRKKRYELLLLGKRFHAWRQVAKLWRKERIYRLNVSARLGERGITEKVEEWSERRNQGGYESAYLSQFPPAEPLRDFPTKGAHKESTGILDAWQPPLEWAVDRDALLLRRQQKLRAQVRSRKLHRHLKKAKRAFKVGSDKLVAGSGFVVGRMRQAARMLKSKLPSKSQEYGISGQKVTDYDRFTGGKNTSNIRGPVKKVDSKNSRDTDVPDFNAAPNVGDGAHLLQMGIEEHKFDTDDTSYLTRPPRRLTRAQALRAAADMASRGYLEVLMWLRANGCEWNEDVCAEATQGGHFELLQWAHTNGCPSDERVAELAARTGQKNILLWAIENDLPRSVPMLVLNAAQGQHLDILQFLATTQTGFSLHPMCATAAIISSDFIGEKGEEMPDNEYPLREVLSFLFEHAESANIFTEETAAAAARRGRLEMLKWLRHMNCPWDWRVLSACRQQRQKHILDWIMKHGGSSIRKNESRRQRSLYSSIFQ